MRTGLVCIASLVFSSAVCAATLTLQPGPEGNDAVLFSRKDAVAKNYASATQFHAGTWTWNADGLGTGTYRSLIAFDLGDLPAGAVIKSATLFLYHDLGGLAKGHSSLSTSDSALLMPVKEAWVESTVTWENQPPVDTAAAVALAKSDSAAQDYQVDVTTTIAAMAADPKQNHGFLLRSAQESPYNDLAFASGDAADSTMRPKLRIEYEAETAALSRRAPKTAAAASIQKVWMAKGRRLDGAVIAKK